MIRIDGNGLDYAALNEKIRQGGSSCRVENCLGQRFLAAGMSGKNIQIDGIPGNALGAYLAGSVIRVNGNAQDAVGDTMNDGEIIVCGSIGDAAGYAMRGGAIYVRGNAGYRAGIHMKEYKEKKPVIVIGGRAGSFLGEYQAGGRILVLGLNRDEKPILGGFPCTGMHGGKLFLRGKAEGITFPGQVSVREADSCDREEIAGYVRKFCEYFGYQAEEILNSPFTVVTPDSRNPYKQMYVAN